MTTYHRGLWRVGMQGDSGSFEKYLVFVADRVRSQAVFYTRGLELWQARDLYNTLCQVADSALVSPLTDEEFKALAEQEEARCRKNVYGT